MSQSSTLRVEVAAIEQLTPLVKQFTLVAADGGELPAFSGGSHVIVVLRRRDRTFRNPYSLLGSPRDRGRYQIAVRRHDDGRGGSAFLHQQVRVGTQLDVSHPVNLFPLAGPARKHLLVAGGIGITPILSMIDDLRHVQAPWELHYCVRGPEHDPYGRQLAERESAGVHLYHSGAGQRPDFAGLLSRQPLGTHVYTCGPAGMIAAVGAAAEACGWPASCVHVEEFTAPPVGEPFDVRLARSGLTVHVAAERSLLEAVEAVGVEAPYLCRGGVCGQCETDVLEVEGELLHHDHWLSDAEKAGRRKIMPCVSRARCTRLVLDR